MAQENYLFYRAASLKTWVLATRPETLTISIGPIIVGAALASLHVLHINWILLVANLLCVPWIQIGMNLINDALDGKREGKSGRESVKGQERRRADLLTTRQFLFGGYFSFVMTLLFGIPLIIVGGWIFAFLLLLSIACAYLYTGGPYPLSYTGTSESFILVFYGWVNTIATFYLQTGNVDASSFLAGTQLGCLAIVPHAINNLRDRVADASVEKKTLAVRFGVLFARWEITILSFIPYLLGLLWFTENRIWMALFPLLSLPLVLVNIQAIWQIEPSREYNRLLATSAKCQLLFGCLLVLAILWN